MNSPTAEYELSIVVVSNSSVRVYCDKDGSFNGVGAMIYAIGY